MAAAYVVGTSWGGRFVRVTIFWPVLVKMMLVRGVTTFWGWF